MKHETIGRSATPPKRCTYGLSRLPFRGPRRAMTGDYVAVVGGSATFGPFVARPFADRLEARLGVDCVNLGCEQVGLGALTRDSAVMAACYDARASVIQVIGAANMTNRFYSVHPRRNDRFLRPSEALTTLFPDVDFADFVFTGHLVSTLRDHDPDRFSLIRDELQAQWTDDMLRLVDNCPGGAVLLALRGHDDPLFVTDAMLDIVAARAGALVQVDASRDGTQGMDFGPLEVMAAQNLPSAPMHDRIAGMLEAPLRQLLA